MPKATPVPDASKLAAVRKFDVKRSTNGWQAASHMGNDGECHKVDRDSAFGADNFETIGFRRRAHRKRHLPDGA